MKAIRQDNRFGWTVFTKYGYMFISDTELWGQLDASASTEEKDAKLLQIAEAKFADREDEE